MESPNISITSNKKQYPLSAQHDDILNYILYSILIKNEFLFPLSLFLFYINVARLNSPFFPKNHNLNFAKRVKSHEHILAQERCLVDRWQNFFFHAGRMKLLLAWLYKTHKHLKLFFWRSDDSFHICIHT